MESSFVCIDQEKEIFIGQFLNQGAFGHVYKGFDALNERLIALKNVENWEEQVKALKQIQGHPCVIEYYDYIPVSKNLEHIYKRGVFIITEYVRAKTLKNVIETHRLKIEGLPQEMVLDIFKQLVDGYAYINSKKYVHRDIKPENILIDEERNVKIIDLGQSKNKYLIQSKQGTPLYQAPEVISGKNPKDARQDVWSLGMVLIEMLTGRSYFYKWLKKHENEAIEHSFKIHYQSCDFKIKFRTDIDQFWEKILKEMLVINYKNRKQMHQIKFMLASQEEALRKRITNKHVKLRKPPSNCDLPQAVPLNKTKNPLIMTRNESEFSTLKRYLRFFYCKHKFLISLYHYFNINKYPSEYPFLSKVHKAILVFLSYEIYLASIRLQLRKLNKGTIQIRVGQSYSLSSFQQPYKSLAQLLFANFKQFYTEQQKIIQSQLNEKIVPFLTNSKKNNKQSQNYATNQEEYISKTVKLYPTVEKLLENYMGKKKLTREHYFKIYRDIIEEKQFVHSINNIKKYFYVGDVSIYLLIRIIANLDEIFQWNDNLMNHEIQKVFEELSDRDRRDEFIERIEELKK